MNDLEKALEEKLVMMMGIIGGLAADRICDIMEGMSGDSILATLCTVIVKVSKNLECDPVEFVEEILRMMKEYERNLNND